jgi:hypothetical protein
MPPGGDCRGLVRQNQKDRQLRLRAAPGAVGKRLWTEEAKRVRVKGVEKKRMSLFLRVHVIVRRFV